MTEDRVDRVSNMFELLLIAVAFLYVVSGKLPPVPYLTWLDEYVLASFFFILALAGYAAIAGVTFPKDDTRYLYDLYALYGASCIYIAMHIYFVVMALYKYYTEKAKLQQYVDSVVQRPPKAIQRTEHMKFKCDGIYCQDRSIGIAVKEEKKNQ